VLKNKSKIPRALFDNIDQINATPSIPKHLQDSPIFQHNDFVIAHSFLYSYKGSEATFNAYRREIERFLHWIWQYPNKNLQEINRVDFESYIEFCQKPPLDWISTSHKKRFINKEGKRIVNPDWRPFVLSVKKTQRKKMSDVDINQYHLSQKALQAIFSVMSSFFNFLIQEDYITTNPVSQIRQKNRFLRKTQQQHVIRRLSELQWAYVIETAQLMAREKPDFHERTLFIMQALYGMYLRISELVASPRWEPQMGHFQIDKDGNWWFHTVGKGNKARQITVSTAMLDALKRYRRYLGLSSLPTPGENTPLIMNQRTGKAISSTRQIRQIVQNCFDATCERLCHDNLTEEAEQLSAATVHWLRHTGISDDVKIRPREHVRDDAGHSSSAITDRYIDVELRARHASGKGKKIMPELLDDNDKY